VAVRVPEQRDHQDVVAEAVQSAHRLEAQPWFVDAARRCFTRLGVEGTSMEQVREEAGVSAGLMYRYFPSKDDMLRAAISGSMLQFEALITEVGSNEKATTAAGYLRLLLDTLRRFRRHTEGVDLFTLAIQGWAHAQARPQTKAIITESFARQLESYRSAARRWTTRAKSEAAAQAIAAAVVGYVVQSAFSDTEIDVARYCNGLTALAGAR